MKYAVIILILLWQCCCWDPLLNAADADLLWKQAVTMAKQGQMDLAFINFRLLVDSYPDFKKTPTAQFDLGEYYFLKDNLPLAIVEFEQSYARYPKHVESLVALAYLYKIAQSKGSVQQMEMYQKKIFSSRPFALVFKNSRSFEYVSGYQYKYKIVFYIERIEVFVDDKLMVSIPC